MSERRLIDESALARYPRQAVRAVIEPLHNAGLLAVCGAVELRDPAERAVQGGRAEDP